MRPTNRRSAIGIGLAAIATPAFAASSPADSTRLVAPPEHDMLYRREAIRELGDGAHLSVAREFTVEFRQFSDGFMLHGRQISAHVDAPESLASFAAIEEARDESALFPIALNPFGQILSSRIAPTGNDSVSAAVDQAVAQLAQLPIPEDERDLLSQSISAMRSAGSRVTAHLPADLFAPVDVPRHIAQNISLPGGLEGTVETQFTGLRDPSTGLMRSAEREVRTLVEGSRTQTTEIWSLTAP